MSEKDSIVFACYASQWICRVFWPFDPLHTEAKTLKWLLSKRLLSIKQTRVNMRFYTKNRRIKATRMQQRTLHTLLLLADAGGQWNPLAPTCNMICLIKI